MFFNKFLAVEGLLGASRFIISFLLKRCACICFLGFLREKRSSLFVMVSFCKGFLLLWVINNCFKCNAVEL